MKTLLQTFFFSVLAGVVCGLIITLGVMSEHQVLSWIVILLLAAIVLYLTQRRCE